MLTSKEATVTGHATRLVSIVHASQTVVLERFALKSLDSLGGENRKSMEKPLKFDNCISLVTFQFPSK